MSIYVKRYISDDVDNSNYTAIFRFLSSSKIDDKGEIFALISVSSSSGFLGDRAVRFVWNAFRDGYLLSSSGSVIEDIKSGMKFAVKKLSELLKNDKELETRGVDLGMSIAVIKGVNAYLGRVGDQGLYIIKNNSLVNVGDILERNKAGVASISFSNTDYIALSTKGGLNELPKVDNDESIIDILIGYGDSISKNEGIVILSREEITEYKDDINQKNLVPEKVIDILDDVITEVVDEQQPSNKIQQVEVVKEENRNVSFDNLLNKGETFKNFLSKIKIFFKILKKYIRLVVSYIEKLLFWLGGFISNIIMDLKLFVDKVFGRKIWYRRLLSRFSFFSLSKSGVQGLKIDGYKKDTLRNRRVGTLVGVILLIGIVLIFINLSIKAKESRENHIYAKQVIDSVKEKLNDAKASINFDKDNAEISIFEARELINGLEDRKYSIDDIKSIADVKKELEQLEDRLFYRVRVSEEIGNLELYVEGITLFGDGSKPEDIVIFKDDFQNEYIYITDSGTKGVYRINLENKGLVKLPDNNNLLFSPKFVDIGVSGLFVYDSVTGVVMSPIDKKSNHSTFKKLIGLEIDDIGGNQYSEMAILTLNDNVYLVSQNDKAIMRSLGTSSGYSILTSLYSADILKKSNDFFGDNVASYIISREGVGVYRLNSNAGRLVNSNISISGLKPDTGSFTAGYTSGSLDAGFYVFDEMNKRIIRFEKPKETAGDILHPNELFVLKQYIYSGNRNGVFSDVKDIVVDSSETYMYVLDDTKVWKITL